MTLKISATLALQEGEEVEEEEEGRLRGPGSGGRRRTITSILAPVLGAEGDSADAGGAAAPLQDPEVTSTARRLAADLPLFTMTIPTFAEDFAAEDVDADAGAAGRPTTTPVLRTVAARHSMKRSTWRTSTTSTKGEVLLPITTTGLLLLLTTARNMMVLLSDPVPMDRLNMEKMSTWNTTAADLLGVLP